MSKPLAQHHGANDLEKVLKSKILAEDPMAEYVTKKKRKADVSRMPEYSGPPTQPNRFGLKHGYRWDRVDRSNGFEKRCKFLKFSVKKANKFLDKRLMNGEDDSRIDRLVLERKNKLKKAIFNLKEESLTHKGMPLDATKMFPDDKDGDSEDEEQLDASYVNRAHFGGFCSESKEPKSHKEIMEELIVESKKKKQEKKMEKEENQDLTENLDKGWKDFLSVVGGMKFGNSNLVSEKPDPYILLTNQLKFEKRGTPASRKKTAEEMEKEEKERIEKLEQERLNRMNADLKFKFRNTKEDHISADGIYDDDDFYFEYTVEELKREENDGIKNLELERFSHMNADLEHKFKYTEDQISSDGICDDDDFYFEHTIAESSVPPDEFLAYIDKMQQSFQKCKEIKKKSDFVILKYCSALFSVSDYRHPVVTPAMIFMCDILSSKYLITIASITSRLFVCSVIADCISQSQRFVPEAICFLNKVLQLAIPVKTEISSKGTKKKEIDLVVHKKPASNKIDGLNLFSSEKTILNDSIKLRVISNAVSQLHKFSTLYTGLPSYSEIFYKTSLLCSQLPTNYYSDSLKVSIESFSSKIKKGSSLCHLVYANTKPKPLKLFEPSFESKFDKKDNISKKFKLLKRVSQKIRKEEKSVLREMRRDAQMIAVEKLRETLESDAERKRKVKELYHDLATQEGEYKKMMKKK